MSEIGLVAAAALVGAAWVLGLWCLGVSTHPAVRSWRRLARMRGLAGARTFGERVGGRLPLLHRLQAETDVGRLLAIAGRGESPGGWLLRTGGQAGVALAATLLLDELTLAAGGQAAFPPALGLAAGASVALLAYLRLRLRAAARRQALDRAVADALPHLAVMTYHHRLPVSEALLVFARCQRDTALHTLLGSPPPAAPEPAPGPGEPAPVQGTALTYERIGQAYGVPMFTALGSAVRRVTERGLSGQEVYTALARATYAQRLAEARIAAAQAKTLIVIPVGLMIVPVLVLIGAPLVASLAGIFAR